MSEERDSEEKQPQNSNRKKGNSNSYTHLPSLEGANRWSRRGWLKAGLGGVVATSGCLSISDDSQTGGDSDDGESDSTGQPSEDDELDDESDESETDERSIAIENERAGHDGWQPQQSPSERPAAVTHQIEGYTSSTSVEPGGTLEFAVSTDSEWRYRIDLYRLGWYDGAGGRLVTTLQASDDGTNGQRQPVPDPDPDTGRVACDWEYTDILEVPEDWLSGLYVARFVLLNGPAEGTSTAHPFVVRPHPDRDATGLVQLPLATAQAYNGWGGKSLYDHTSNGTPANEVSHDRPYVNEITFHLGYAVHLLRFLEREGYDVAYACDYDVHRAPDVLEAYDAVISAGHDEYWSREQRLAFERARDNGVNLGFFGSNIAYWQIRYDEEGRSYVCYKETVEDDPIQDERRTGLFRDVGLPECELQGVMGWGAGLYNFPDYEVTVEAMDHPWMANTGFEAGDTIEAVVGPEWDWIRDDCPLAGEPTNFFHHEAGSSDLDIHKPADADAVAYTAPSGATVFSAGTLAYTRAIDPDPDWDISWPYVRVKAYAPPIATPDERLQQFTLNMLDEFFHGGNPSFEP
ncbi:N,N-dimethylformamidase beta subunit family domain-containing protein [Natrialbaceae archaeon A-chndr2]